MSTWHLPNPRTSSSTCLQLEDGDPLVVLVVLSPAPHRLRCLRLQLFLFARLVPRSVQQLLCRQPHLLFLSEDGGRINDTAMIGRFGLVDAELCLLLSTHYLHLSFASFLGLHLALAGGEQLQNEKAGVNRGRLIVQAHDKHPILMNVRDVTRYRCYRACLRSQAGRRDSKRTTVDPSVSPVAVNISILVPYRRARVCERHGVWEDITATDMKLKFFSTIPSFTHSSPRYTGVRT